MADEMMTRTGSNSVRKSVKRPLAERSNVPGTALGAGAVRPVKLPPHSISSEAPTQLTVRNQLLRGLSQDDFKFLASHLEHVTLVRSKILQETRQPVHDVYFIESGVISAIAEGNDGHGAEAGQIGREGMTGRSVVMGYGTSSVRIVTHVAGAAWRIEAGHFSSAMEDRRSLRAFMLRYLHTSDVQLAYTLLAACRATVRQRIARWLLMCHDRTDGDNLPITHVLLADILGTRRASVTVEVQVLEGLNAIRARRGNVQIRDRAKLIEIADGFYGQPEEAYGRILFPSARKR